MKFHRLATGITGAVIAACLLVAAAARPARAYDPATTHAGLTQQAAIASALHRVLALRLARPLGVFEPLALHPELLATDERRELMARLMALDPAGGYRPGDDGVAPALAFVVAGSVIAKTPPERVQNMFFDPSTGAGLRDDAAIDGFVHALRLFADAGGSTRQLATGAGFALHGEPSLKWLDDPLNDGGLAVFQQQLERALVEPDPAARSSALARALMALGGVLTVLEDAGNPPQVRNDFRATYLKGRASSPFDRSSRFEHAVADFYGWGGIPSPRVVVRRPNVRSYFTAADGQGLADRTQRRFFSEGTVPRDGVIEHDTTAADVVRDARQSLTYALPSIEHLDLRHLGDRHYVMAIDGPGDVLRGTAADGSSSPPATAAAPRRILAYERVAGRVRFFLDGRVHADTARVLLPEIAGYAAGLIDHLLRAEVQLTREGATVRANVMAPAGPIQGGKLRIFADDAHGQRRELSVRVPQHGDQDADQSAVGGVTVVVPGDARRIAAVLRGHDDAGPVVAFGELALPARR
ncbi:MAG: hypothetical protein ABIS92_06380 [Polyangia bacterium]